MKVASEEESVQRCNECQDASSLPHYLKCRQTRYVCDLLNLQLGGNIGLDPILRWRTDNVQYGTQRNIQSITTMVFSLICEGMIQ